ncbi:hypothetical protein NMG60_11014600 [Bertholletia excelsa]
MLCIAEGRRWNGIKKGSLPLNNAWLAAAEVGPLFQYRLC